MRRIAVLLAAASFVVAFALGAGAPSAGADNLSDAQSLFALTNQTRASNGLPPLQWDAAAASIATGWSAAMAGTQVLSHNPVLVSQISALDTSSWTRIGENVGYAYSVTGVQNAFVNSAPHFANIVGDYNRVGIGVVKDGAGRLWVTLDFVKGPPLPWSPTRWATTSSVTNVAPVSCTSCRRPSISGWRRR